MARAISISEAPGWGRAEIRELLGLSAPDDIQALFAAADAARQRYIGPGVHLRGIIEFSNYCERGCQYCGLRRANAGLARYRMRDDEILAATADIRAAGIGTVVLQSGEDPYYTIERLCALVKRIKDETGMVITLSLGELGYEAFAALREAGADRYLLKHETSDAALAQHLRPGRKPEDRLQSLRWLKALGFETGSGCMAGLPGQSLESLADDILLFKELDIDMIGIGPFIPHPQTPLAGSSTGDTVLVLKAMAITRLVTRTTNIPATTALATLDHDGRRKALAVGANIIMPDFTPVKYRRLYEIYPGKGQGTADPRAFIEAFRVDLAAWGRTLGDGPGNRRSV